MLKDRELKMLATVTGKCIKETLEPIRARLDALESERANFKYVGTWSAGKQFRKGNFTTHNGALWHCNSDTVDKPGASNDWVLAVKSGQR